MDRELKKMVKDQVKSLERLEPRHLIEWAAADIQEYDFSKYSLESIFKEGDRILALMVRKTSLKIWYAKRSIKQGKIFLRSRKVDPSKPPRFREDGWAIRNQSTRADKTVFGAGMKFLTFDKPWYYKFRIKRKPKF